MEKRGAAGALGHIQPQPELERVAGPLMIQALESDRPGVRTEAANTLGMIGRNSADVKAALKNVASDQDEEVRKAVRNALSKLEN